MRQARSRRRSCRPRHARPSWIVRCLPLLFFLLSPRWLAACLVVCSLGGMAALLSPQPEPKAAQHTAAAAPPSSVTPYFTPKRNAVPALAAPPPPPQPLTRSVSMQAAALPRPARPPAVSTPVANAGSAERTDAAGQFDADRWSPQQTEAHPPASARCDDSFLTLWSECGGRAGS